LPEKSVHPVPSAELERPDSPLDEDAGVATGPAADGAEKLLERVALAPQLAEGGGGLRVARILSMSSGVALIAWRGRDGSIPAVLAPGVEAELLEEVIEDGGSVLVEEGPPPLVVGVLQTRRPREIQLRAGAVTIEGEREVLIRAGRAAIRLREDGDIEIVGSRISAASRGLFRLVGRILRLN
jgi:hypothetical protein